LVFVSTPSGLFSPLSQRLILRAAELGVVIRMALRVQPTVADIMLYVKIVLRGDCAVVSFHKDEPDEEGS
jgi:hypothetical protein